MSEGTPKPTEPRADLAHDRTSLAAFRTGLALDRTTLAWIRTTLSMAGFGFGLVGFFRTLEEKSPSAGSVRLHHGAIRMGTALIIVGIVATIVVATSHRRTLQRLRRAGSPTLTQPHPTTTLSLPLATIALLSLS